MRSITARVMRKRVIETVKLKRVLITSIGRKYQQAFTILVNTAGIVKTGISKSGKRSIKNEITFKAAVVKILALKIFVFNKAVKSVTPTHTYKARTLRNYRRDRTEKRKNKADNEKSANYSFKYSYSPICAKS